MAGVFLCSWRATQNCEICLMKQALQRRSWTIRKRQNLWWISSINVEDWMQWNVSVKRCVCRRHHHQFLRYQWTSHHHHLPWHHLLIPHDHHLQLVSTANHYRRWMLLILLFVNRTISRNHGWYWAGRTLLPNNLPPNMTTNDLCCSEMPHYCRVVIHV